MSETLSVIDEHITDMKSPRTGYVNGSGDRDRDTMSSVYSTQPPFTRSSYIAGHETDEEEQRAHTEEEVMAWGPARVAEHLEDHGVEKSHCDVFVEQEISGEVLLAMDQNSLFIKEFELGSVGRRLKTWHKIKALQDEVRRSGTPEVDRSVSEYSLGQDADEPPIETGRNRSSTIGAPSLPRALTTKRQSGDATTFRSSLSQPHMIAQQATPGASKRESAASLTGLSSMNSMIRADNARPSAQSIRNLNHSRRHSSMDSNPTDGAIRLSHRKQPSIEPTWQPEPPANGRRGHTTSVDTQFPHRNTSGITPASPGDLDRGYFSSTELDSRSRRNVLTKRNSATASPAHSRDSSTLDVNVLPGRFVSPSSYEEPPVSPIASPTHSSNAWNAVNRRFANYRSVTTPTARTRSKTSGQSTITPVVTKLDPSSKPSLDATASSPIKLDDNVSEASSDKATPSPASHNMSFFSQARAKVTGLRSISDAVTRDEKTSSPTKLNSPTRFGTRSSTPSTENRSLEINKSDVASRGSTGSGQNLMPPPPVPKRPRAKSKKFTSAYTRGLERKTPEEKMQDCDYSGWMKKKSGSLVATWKPRLFILKGRRLSYYYKDDDTEEKGLIDISYHRVLPAQNETLTGVLATVTGAGASPTSPNSAVTPTLAQQDRLAHPPKADEHDDGLFIFKLVPPKAGLSKGVHFTKPTVHYFAVNSKQEGRLWMAALMKATIDRDDTGVVTTTYNQKTISLSTARARRERPPALKDDTPDSRPEVGNGGETSEAGDTGLGIGGLATDDAAVPGVEQEKENRVEDTSSMAPSIDASVENSILDEKEQREIVPLPARS